MDTWCMVGDDTWNRTTEPSHARQEQEAEESVCFPGASDRCSESTVVRREVAILERARDSITG